MEWNAHLGTNQRVPVGIGVDGQKRFWYNTHMKTTTTQESKTMDIFEATARNLMSQHDITTRKALVSAMRELGYARFAADRTADKIFGKPEPMQWKHYD